MKVVLVTGGARSGKSTFGENYISQLASRIAYIATAIPFDDEMKSRIQHHKNTRPAHWTTVEKYFEIDRVLPDIAVEHDGIILDCVTLMVSNLMLESPDIDWSSPDPALVNQIQTAAIEHAAAIVETLRAQGLNGVLITNEIGMGIVPENPMARAFRDIAGRVNQALAALSDEVWLLVSGIPVKIK
jgi:adenosylcobinamide kinase/adenosylcobinamide-phosphate guanylyltransferase